MTSSRATLFAGAFVVVVVVRIVIVFAATVVVVESSWPEDSRGLQMSSTGAIQCPPSSRSSSQLRPSRRWRAAFVELIACRVAANSEAVH